MMDYKLELSKIIDKNYEDLKEEVKLLNSRLNNAKHICLFGAGSMGIDTAYYLNSKTIKIDCFCDNNSKIWGENICLNIPCISPSQLQHYKNGLLIIISSSYYSEIIKQLEENALYNYLVFPMFLYLRIKDYIASCNVKTLKDNIYNLISILEDKESIETLVSIIKKWFNPINSFYEINVLHKSNGKQYFPSDIIKLTSKEVFIDVGAYNGDTMREFLDVTNKYFSNIIAYELDKNNFGKLQKEIQKYEPVIKNKIISYNMGLFDKNMLIKYSSNTTSGSINDKSETIGKVVALSNHLTNLLPTYIKMDIEGAELDALIGAEEIIKRCKPKLAVCVYHNPEHFWQIPFYIKRLAPEYRIYLRHHSLDITETVCYAVT